MKILVFGGQSPRNKQWLASMHQQLLKAMPAADITLHTYDFWEHSPLSADDEKQIEHEVGRALELYAGQHFDCIVGKSFGAYCALQLSRALKPSGQILIGLPIRFLGRAKAITAELAHTQIPTWLVANTNDPIVGSYDFEMLSVQNSCIHAPYLRDRADHTYDEFGLYARLATDIRG